MKINALTLPGLAHIVPDVHGDERGFFMEAYHRKHLAEVGIDVEVFQQKHTRSQKNVVRGLHFQWDSPMGKLMRVTRGRAFVVAADIKKNSATRGRWEARELSEDNKELLWIPFGFAAGFCALEDVTEVQYYCTAYYNQQGESGIAWNDPTFNIAWPVSNPILSKRDSVAQIFTAWLARPESHFIS